MRAVTGSLLSSEPISLRRATGVLSNFAAADTGARPEIAAYVRRASRAFNELLQFHREIRASHKSTGHDTPGEEQQQLRNKKKRKREAAADGWEAGDDGILIPRQRPDGIGARQGEEARNLAGGVENGVVLGIDEERDVKRKKKEKRRKTEEEDERESLERKHEDEVWVKEEKSEERRKKKDRKRYEETEPDGEEVGLKEERSKERKKEKKGKKRNREAPLDEDERYKESRSVYGSAKGASRH